LVFITKIYPFTTLWFDYTIFMNFVFIWEHTAYCATYSINWLVFITKIYPFAPQWSLYIPPVYHSTTLRSAHILFMCFVFIWEQTANCATYSINWLAFITKIYTFTAQWLLYIPPVNIQQLYALPTLYLRFLYLSYNIQRLVPLTA